jgi:type IV pilus assembly protein PilA
MGSLKLKKQRGFTIVELLIVIVVIGILAAIVITSFAGVQAKARDAKRQTDIRALAAQLEKYYADNNGYPQFSQVNSAANATTLLKGLDAGGLTAPGQATGTFSLVTTATSAAPTANKDNYVYQPLATASTLCATNDACPSFKLYYTLESGGLQTKQSLNTF